MRSFFDYLQSFFFFITEAAVLVSFLWEFSKISKRKFLLIASLCGLYINLFQMIGNNIFHSNLMGSATLFILNTLLCCTLLFFLVKLSAGAITYSIIFSMKYAIFLNAIPFFNVVNTSFYSITIRLLLTIILCYTIHRFVVPLFRIYQGTKTWLLLSIAPLLEAIGLWIVLLSPRMRYLPFLSEYYIGLSLIFIATLLGDIMNARIIQYIINATSLSERVAQMDHLLALQKDRFREFVQNIEQERKFKHDLRHHMRAIRTLIDHEDYKEVKTYITEVSDAIPETIIISGNAAADAIISHYLAKANNVNITTTCQVSIPESSKLIDTELSVIIGNCLENSIEACLKLPMEKRWLSMGTSSQGNFLTLTFKNSFDGTILMKDNQFLSTKRENHSVGIGLASVKELAQKYHGTVEILNDSNTFTIRIILQYN